MKRSLIFAIMLLFLAAIIMAQEEATERKNMEMSWGENKYTIEADKITIPFKTATGDKNIGSVKAAGDVILIINNQKFTAEEMSFDQTNGIIDFQGSVKVALQDTAISSDKLQFFMDGGKQILTGNAKIEHATQNADLTARGQKITRENIQGGGMTIQVEPEKGKKAFIRMIPKGNANEDAIGGGKPMEIESKKQIIIRTGPNGREIEFLSAASEVMLTLEAQKFYADNLLLKGKEKILHLWDDVRITMEEFNATCDDYKLFMDTETQVLSGDAKLISETEGVTAEGGKITLYMTPDGNREISIEKGKEEKSKFEFIKKEETAPEESAESESKAQRILGPEMEL